jgi:hypothetical protein
MPESIEVDIRKAMATLTDIQKRQIPYALSKAINAEVDDVQTALQKEMRDVIDRPRPSTIKAVRKDYSSKRQDVIQGRVYLADWASTALRPLIEGGARGQKKWESRYVSKVFGGTAFAIPSNQFKTDQYGNISGATISAIIAKLGLNQYAVKTRLTKTGKVAGATYFAVGNKTNSSAAMGIYKRVGKKVTPVAFIQFRAPQYQQGYFDFFYVARKTVERTFDKHFERELANALATAR